MTRGDQDLYDADNQTGPRSEAGEPACSPLASLSDGSAVLVRGPAMTGKYELALRALATAADRSILVSTSNNAGSVRDRFAVHGAPETIGVVDCVTRVHDQRVEDSEYVRYAASPQNLTEVGVKFTDLVESIRDDDPTSVAVGVHSLSALLMYWEVEQVYRFVRVLLNQVQRFGWTAFCVLDDAATDEQTVNTIAQPFDAVVQTRQSAEVPREYRLQANGQQPTGWTSF